MLVIYCRWQLVSVQCCALFESSVLISSDSALTRFELKRLTIETSVLHPDSRMHRESHEAALEKRIAISHLAVCELGVETVS